MRVAMVFLWLVAALACSGEEPGQKYTFVSSLHEEEIELRDGRRITCIVYSGLQKGGLSCDWNPRWTAPR